MPIKARIQPRPVKDPTDKTVGGLVERRRVRKADGFAGASLGALTGGSGRRALEANVA